MKRFTIGISLVGAVATAVAAGAMLRARASQAPAKIGASIASTGSSGAVLVELFTSEGCSSCPPADVLLARLAHDKRNVIAIEEHVDYWNSLGWTDPFSSSRYSVRQQAYARLFKLNQVYTPQMVVDGSRELLGSDEDAAHSAIDSSSAKPSIKVSAEVVENDTLNITVHLPAISGKSKGDTPEVYAIVTEDGLHSSVPRGENAGRKLEHFGVARSWQQIGSASTSGDSEVSGKISTKSEWKRANSHIIVLVQGHESGKVFAVATVAVPE